MTLFEDEADLFLVFLNNIHPALKFTQIKDFPLPFLMFWFIEILRVFLTSFYRKTRFTGLYSRWDTFCFIKRKINIIKKINHMALKICSKTKQDDEIRFITTTLRENAYPLGIVQSVIKHKITEFKKVRPVSVQ